MEDIDVDGIEMKIKGDPSFRGRDGYVESLALK